MTITLNTASYASSPPGRYPITAISVYMWDLATLGQLGQQEEAAQAQSLDPTG